MPVVTRIAPTSLKNLPVSIDTASSSMTATTTAARRLRAARIILYVNSHCEKNLTTSKVTTYYYLGDRLTAMPKGTTLDYIHEDHLTGTSVVSDSSGASVASIKFYPYGATRSGSVPTDKKFTGQRLDGTGLYYYNARYYDPAIGRFISADRMVPSPANPQSLNRYGYVNNNPLKYIDPTGYMFFLPPPPPPTVTVDPGPPGGDGGGGGGDGGGTGGGTGGSGSGGASSDLPIDKSKVGEIIFDALGRIWTSPNTVLGLVIGGWVVVHP